MTPRSGPQAVVAARLPGAASLGLGAPPSATPVPVAELVDPAGVAQLLLPGRGRSARRSRGWRLRCGGTRRRRCCSPRPGTVGDQGAAVGRARRSDAVLRARWPAGRGHVLGSRRRPGGRAPHDPGSDHRRGRGSRADAGGAALGDRHRLVGRDAAGRRLGDRGHPGGNRTGGNAGRGRRPPVARTAVRRRGWDPVRAPGVLLPGLPGARRPAVQVLPAPRPGGAGTSWAGSRDGTDPGHPVAERAAGLPRTPAAPGR